VKVLFWYNHWMIDSIQAPPKDKWSLHVAEKHNVSDGLCNGTRFTLIDIDGHILTCRIIHDDKSKKDKTCLLSRITTKPTPISISFQ
jgi:hypothetical protein